MNVLIVEDEPPIAADIEDYARQFCGRHQSRIKVAYSLDDAREYLEKEQIDLMLLDLNLSGRNGFDILKEISARNFHTIVISAYTDKALEAFEYGILDFVAKPIRKERIQVAFERFLGRRKVEGKGAKFLVVHKASQYHLVPVESIRYFKADGYLVEIHESAEKVNLIEKSLNHLEQILPERFVRTHRSYIVDINRVLHYRHLRSGSYEMTMDDGTRIPLSGKRLKAIPGMIRKDDPLPGKGS